MSEFLWTLLDDDGTRLRSSGRFETRAEAEAWLTGDWPSLADEGVASVALMEDGDELYRMSLAAEEGTE